MYNIQIFLNFGGGFCGSFSMLFPKAPASCGKNKIEVTFATFYLYVYELKKCISNCFSTYVSQTGDINIFVLRGVFFSGYV